MQFRRFIAGLIVVSLVLPLPAQARLIGTEAALSSVNRDRIASLLQRTDVRAALEARGVAPTQVESRVAALTDQEIDQLAGRVEDLPAGGVVEDLIGALVLVFIVLLITDILGVTKVFPFTKPIR